MRVHVHIDAGAVAFGFVLGLIAAPFFYGKKSLKKTATKGAIKEVASEAVTTTKGFFHKKKEED